MSVILSPTLGKNIHEILMIEVQDTFDLDNFEEYLSNIQDRWELGLNQNLNLYVLQLDFLSICDRLNNELSLGREFLSRYKDSKYQDIDIMNEQKID